MDNTQAMTSGTVASLSDRRKGTTRALLNFGLVAGPIYVLVGLFEILVRPGFDVTRHPLSLMSNGDLGWIHISMMIVTGLFTVAYAVGLHRVLRGGPAGTWAPRLLALYGIGLIGGGIFVADPMDGFPIGTPAGISATITWHGGLHLLVGAIGFLGLISASLILARRFHGRGERAWAAYSVVTGIAFLGAFVGIGAGSSVGGTVASVLNVTFGLSVVLAWSWISATAARFRAEIAAGT